MFDSAVMEEIHEKTRRLLAAIFLNKFGDPNFFFLFQYEYVKNYY